MLILPIKKKWFDMIRSGEKKEEYRDYTDYYFKRFKRQLVFSRSKYRYVGTKEKFEIILRNGYSHNSPQIKCVCSLKIGEGKQKWGAEKDRIYFILRIWEVEQC